jgi:hypothetical protein
MKEIDVIVKRGGLSLSNYRLKINHEFISIQNISQIRSGAAILNAKDVAGYRFGIIWLRGLEFPIGKQYEIHVRAGNGQDLKIIFRSFYGIGNKRLNTLFNRIIQAIDQFFYSDQLDVLLNKYKNGDEIEIDAFNLSREGIFLKPKGIMIVWDDLGLTEFGTYFSIASKSNPAFANTSFYYLKDWNSYFYLKLFHSVLRINK